MQPTVIGEKLVGFFLWNLDSYIKWKPILCMQNSGLSIPTRVYWSTWLQCEDKCYALGMCDILRGWDTSTNIWKYELWDLIKIYGQSLQNTLEILHVYSKMTIPHVMFDKIICREYSLRINLYAVVYSLLALLLLVESNVLYRNCSKINMYRNKALQKPYSTTLHAKVKLVTNYSYHWCDWKKCVKIKICLAK